MGLTPLTVIRRIQRKVTSITTPIIIALGGTGKTTRQEAIDALKKLKENKEFFESMVVNGHMRTSEYDQDAVSKYWADLLNGPVTEEYEHWLDRRNLVCWLIEFPKFASRIVRHKMARYIFNWYVK